MDASEPISASRELIAESRYLALATAGPWIATVNYAVGRCGELLFCSPPEARHSTDVEARREVAVAIHRAVDLTTISGVQIVGRCRPAGPEDLDDKRSQFYESAFPDPLVRQQWEVPLTGFGPVKPRMVYAITIDECWLFDTRNAQQGTGARRHAVDAKALVLALSREGKKDHGHAGS
ncbi:hypothetical protein QRX50_29775 [Amycolatopsis carbonis]|uniref:Pyridoxamine 5'-phosphate oxidase putative domain-containing protein n=1 Tax=Amycolatopsis carbonis TaxID=715471 RepID=A0A9Y2IAR5_9PSEU|nr:hypothetical protein [Amycolatopsis sp. 2-15]WIX75675.1 hypothetical protein QRX50_29775 [Amycolatopsis sp. 2-15]